MKRNVLNFLIDAVSALVMLGLVATGLLVRFVLPPGSGSRRTLWTLGRHDWGGLHFWLAAGTAALMLVHVALHWRWVCATTVRLFGRSRSEQSGPLPRNLAGAALVVLLIGGGVGFVALGRANVVDASISSASGDTQFVEGREFDDQEFIRGSSTLAGAADVLGIQVEVLRERLGLPGDVSSDEQLGRLGRQYGFTMNDVRSAGD